MIQLLGIGLLALFFLYAQRKIYERLWNRHLHIALDFQAEGIFEGEQGHLLEIIENRKRLPLPMLKVKFQTSKYLIFQDTQGSRTTDQYYRNDIFQVNGGEKITRTITFSGGRRGYYKIHSVNLVASDLFLTGEMVQSLTADKYFYVYPKPFDSREFHLSLQQLNGEVLTKRHLLEDPFEYRGIREYQPYDDMRSINWKATAKTGDLRVNQKNYTALQSIRIFMNLEDSGILKKTECVEASMQIAAGLARFFLSQGIRVSCFSNGLDLIHKTPLAIEASSGDGQLLTIYKGLARIDTRQEPADFAACFEKRLLQEASGTITLLIAPNHYQSFTTLVEQYQNTGQEYLWFYPVWDTTMPKLPQELAHNIRLIPLRK